MKIAILSNEKVNIYKFVIKPNFKRENLKQKVKILFLKEEEAGCKYRGFTIVSSLLFNTSNMAASITLFQRFSERICLVQRCKFSNKH